MSNVIYYDEYAIELCKKEEKYHAITGKLNPRISKMIEKIFQWDRELNLICRE